MKGAMHRSHCERGFTLLELLVVLAVLGVVTSITIGAFFDLTTYWRTTSLRAEMQERTQNTLEFIRNDLNEVLSAKLSGKTIQGTQESFEYDSDYERFWRMRLENDRIILPIHYPDYSDGKTRLVSVMYHIDRKTGTPTLMRTLGPLGANPPSGTQVRLLEGALSLRFEFLGDGEWHGAWPPVGVKTPVHPEAVRVSMTVTAPNRPWEQITRMAVLPVRTE